jgi:Ni/Co efflux regulator RcnB
MTKPLNRFLVLAAATIMAAGPLVFAPATAQQPRSQPSPQYDQRDNQRSDRRDVRDDQRSDRRDDRDHSKEWRDNRRDARWDQAQHNGYFRNNQWHYGPPPKGQRNITYGYHPWSKGERLGYFNKRYVEVDYRSQRLDKPRRGYHWVRDDRGTLLLAAISSGIITQVILSHSR